VTVGTISNSATPSRLTSAWRHASLLSVPGLAPGRVALFPFFPLSRSGSDHVPGFFSRSGSDEVPGSFGTSPWKEPETWSDPDLSVGLTLTFLWSDPDLSAKNQKPGLTLTFLKPGLPLTFLETWSAPDLGLSQMGREGQGSS
jgi:hypothetical protein